jgi:hypothetical protein
MTGVFLRIRSRQADCKLRKAARTGPFSNHVGTFGLKAASQDTVGDRSRRYSEIERC